MKKVVCLTYFKDDDGKWHQPGTDWECDKDSRFLKENLVALKKKKK